MDIIKSYKEPNTNVIWFNTNNNNFYYFNNGKWRLTNEEILEITYFELKELRDTSKLIPGTTYRITDYTCTTVQEGTQSAGHVFDILVTADDVNVLNENAHAIQHSGDTYFANSDLSAWELKYCLDNDTTRFAWADISSKGRGVIYYMKDEWNNECPYDFKNIQFIRYKINACDKVPDLVGKYATNNANNITVDVSATKYFYTFNGCETDENDDIIGDYDVSTIHKQLSEDCIDYVHNENGEGTYTEDACFSNVISPLYLEYDTDDMYFHGKQLLNNIIFNNDFYCYSYEEGGSTYWNYNTTNCYGNKLEANCYDNTFGNECSSNTFGNECSSNTFGNYCNNNTFGNSFQYNTFGNECYYNTFGNSCGSNTFGNYCNNNTFGNNCYYNTFGNEYTNNNFGNSCRHNTFGNYCYNNTFGNSFQYNTFGNEFRYNTFGNDYIQYCTFFDGIQYLDVSITTSNTNKLQNMQVLNGTQGTSNSKLQITGSTYVTAGRAYTTTIGKNSSGTLTSKVLMDA